MITISAGQSTLVPFNIDTIDDFVVDGTQTVAITASAEGFELSVGIPMHCSKNEIILILKEYLEQSRKVENLNGAG